MCFFKKRKAKKEAKRQAELEALKANEKKAVEDEKKVPKVEEKKVEVKKEEPKVVETKDDDEKVSNKVVKYHVSQNKDDKSPNFKQWRVRKQGSQKTIKYFNTQVEAIEFAEDLAEKAGSSIVIHKVDGSIRKQDYTKK